MKTVEYATKKPPCDCGYEFCFECSNPRPTAMARATVRGGERFEDRGGDGYPAQGIGRTRSDNERSKKKA